MNPDNVVPFKTELIVFDIFTVNSTDYFYCSLKSDLDSSFVLLAEDVALDLSPVRPSQLEAEGGEKLDYPRKFYAINPEGAYLYAGPSELYDKVSEKLPEGTEITGEYYVGAIENFNINDAYEKWIYATYNNISGWAYVPGNPTAHPDFARIISDSRFYSGENGNSVYFVNDTPIFKSMYSAGEYYKNNYKEDQSQLNNSIIGTVPKNTELVFDYYACELSSLIVRINYNGITGWVSAEAPYCERDLYYLRGANSETSTRRINYYLQTDRDMTAYTEPDNLSSATDIKIPSGYILKADFIYATDIWNDSSETEHQTLWIRVNYKGNNLWVTEEIDDGFAEGKRDGLLYSLECYKVIDPETIVIHTRPDENSEIAGKVKAGDTIYLGRNYGWNWVIVRFGDNQYGWIKNLINKETEAGLERGAPISDLDDFVLPLDVLNGEEPEETKEETVEEKELALVSSPNEKGGLSKTVLILVIAVKKKKQ